MQMRSLNRREFLRTAGLTAAVIALGVVQRVWRKEVRTSGLIFCSFFPISIALTGSV